MSVCVCPISLFPFSQLFSYSHIVLDALQEKILQHGLGCIKSVSRRACYSLLLLTVLVIFPGCEGVPPRGAGSGGAGGSSPPPTCHARLVKVAHDIAKVFLAQNSNRDIKAAPRISLVSAILDFWAQNGRLASIEFEFQTQLPEFRLRMGSILGRPNHSSLAFEPRF